MGVISAMYTCNYCGEIFPMNIYHDPMECVRSQVRKIVQEELKNYVAVDTVTHSFSMATSVVRELPLKRKG